MNNVQLVMNASPLISGLFMPHELYRSLAE